MPSPVEMRCFMRASLAYLAAAIVTAVLVPACGSPGSHTFYDPNADSGATGGSNGTGGASTGGGGTTSTGGGGASTGGGGGGTGGASTGGGTGDGGPLVVHNAFAGVTGGVRASSPNFVLIYSVG